MALILLSPPGQGSRGLQGLASAAPNPWLGASGRDTWAAAGRERGSVPPEARHVQPPGPRARAHPRPARDLDRGTARGSAKVKGRGPHEPCGEGGGARGSRAEARTKVAKSGALGRGSLRPGPRCRGVAGPSRPPPPGSPSSAEAPGAPAAAGSRDCLPAPSRPRPPLCPDLGERNRHWFAVASEFPFQISPTPPPPCSPPGHPEAAAEASSLKSRRAASPPLPRLRKWGGPRARPVPPPPPQAGARPRGPQRGGGAGRGWEGLGGRQAGPWRRGGDVLGVAPASKKPRRAGGGHCTVGGRGSQAWGRD